MEAPKRNPLKEFLNNCRVCLCDCSNFSVKSLYETIDVKSTLTVAEIITESISIQISRDDGLPKMICDKCIEQALAALEFKQKFEKTDSYLRLLLANNLDNHDEEEMNENCYKKAIPVEVRNFADVKAESTEIEDSKIEFDSSTIVFTVGNRGRKRNVLRQKSPRLRGKIITTNEQLGAMCEIKEEFEESSDVKLSCDNCKTVFKSKQALLRHKFRRKCDLEINEPNATQILIKCMDCENVFKNVKLLKRHRRLIHGERQFKCGKCDKFFSSKMLLASHFAEKHTTTSERVACRFCSKSFIHLTRYNTHMMQDHPNVVDETARKFSCCGCDKLFPTPKSLYAHEKRNHGERKHLCADCGKSFPYMANLKRHRITHSKEMAYVCSICDKSYKYQNLYAGHMRSHTGEKPYKCNVCEKGFTQPGHLTVHVLRHEGIKDYECNVCGKRFTEKGGLNAHSKIHTGETRYACPVCAKGFYFFKTMRKHLKTHRCS